MTLKSSGSRSRVHSSTSRVPDASVRQHPTNTPMKNQDSPELPNGEIKDNEPIAEGGSILEDFDSKPMQVGSLVESLKEFFELKENGGLTEAEYQGIKNKILADHGIKTIASSTFIPQTTKQPVTPELFDSTQFALYAGEMHRLIVQQIEEQYSKKNGNTKEYLLSCVDKLLKINAFYPEDLEYLQRLIDTVCKDFAQTPLSFGFLEISDIYEQVRFNVNISDSAKTIIEIAYDSAKRALKDEAQSERQQPTQEKTGNRQSFWNIVLQDAVGAFAGADSTTGIIQISTLGIVGTLGTLGNPAILVPLGMVIGAGVMSGIMRQVAKSS